MDLQFAGIVEDFRTKVRRLAQRHVAAVAVLLCLGRIVKTAGSVAGNSAEQIRIVVVLAAQKFLVVVQLERQADLVACAAELFRFVKRLQERLLVEGRFGFDELLVDPLQTSVFAERERVVQRLLDRVVRVADVAVDVGNRVADGAGDPRVSGRVADVIVVRVVEGAAEERDGIVTARAPAGRSDITVPLQ